MSLVRWSALVLVVAWIAGCGGRTSGSGSTGGGGTNSTTVTVKFPGTAPIAVAAKIGSGVFTAETLSSGILSISIPGGTSTFAVAFVCPPTPVLSNSTQIGQTLQETVMEASAADGPSFTQTCAEPLPPPQTATLTGSVDATAILTASYVGVDAQSGISAASYYSGSPSASFSLSAPAGSDRVEVLAFNGVSQVPLQTFSLVAAKNFSSQVVPGALNGGSPVVLGAADETTQAPITYTNVPSGFSAPSTSAIYQMAAGGAFLIADVATSQYPVLPAGAIQNGDSYAFVARARNGLQAVSSSITNSAGAAVTFSFPDPWSYAGPTPAALPTIDFNYTGFAGQSGVREFASVGWSVGAYSEDFITASATANYQNGATTIAIPDLSGLQGFLANPASGVQAVWAAQISQNTGGTVVGSLTASRSVQNGGTYTVP